MKTAALLEAIRSAIRDQRYRISSHANEEMSEDRLTSNDLECIILKGRVARRLSDDPRGTRYEVLGPTEDGRMAFAVCRFLTSRTLLIITMYTREGESR